MGQRSCWYVTTIFALTRCWASLQACGHSGTLHYLLLLTSIDCGSIGDSPFVCMGMQAALGLMAVRPTRVCYRSCFVLMIDRCVSACAAASVSKTGRLLVSHEAPVTSGMGSSLFIFC